MPAAGPTSAPEAPAAPAPAPVPALLPPATTSGAVTADPRFGPPDTIPQFAQDVAARDKLDAAWIESVLAQAVFLPDIRPLMVPPSARGFGNWRAYRARFVDPIRINAGVRFWQRNRDTLARAQAEFGVPPEIIVGILGVETVYGRNMGSFRVLDTLSTLAFDFPREHPRAAARQAYFRNELAQFLLLCVRNGLDPADAVGSYAGAMGIPQFMPSSWLRYAIDFEGDGHVDLWDNETDAIGSVANYFKEHGWQPGEPTHFSVTLAPGADLDALLAPDITPTFSAAQFQAMGADLSAAGRGYGGPLALIRLTNGNPARPGHAPSYVAGTQNFYVVTRYNHSAFYAMSVIDLGEQIAKALRQREATASE
ncbi:MAG: lytic murein transglycosylase B [Burkholderiaceae bacterium]|nr:MAG: lytic murein transglycosylase B [Burkholderiaceae bacterium]